MTQTLEQKAEELSDYISHVIYECDNTLLTEVVRQTILSRLKDVYECGIKQGQLIHTDDGK